MLFIYIYPKPVDILNYNYAGLDKGGIKKKVKAGPAMKVFMV